MAEVAYMRAKAAKSAMKKKAGGVPLARDKKQVHKKSKKAHKG